MSRSLPRNSLILANSFYQTSDTVDATTESASGEIVGFRVRSLVGARASVGRGSRRAAVRVSSTSTAALSTSTSMSTSRDTGENSIEVPLGTTDNSPPIYRWVTKAFIP